MRNGSSIQSLDRGMRILELLAENQGMTASAIANHLGVHQSTASRLLNSLINAGMVYKPEFHLFALDYGVLVFAGNTMKGFPLVARATTVCDDILHEHGYNAAVAVLHRHHLVYLAVCATGASIRLMDDDDFPVHLSSLGRVLAFDLGKEDALEIFDKSLGAYGGKTSASAEEIYARTRDLMDDDGVIFMRDESGNHFNIAKIFEFGNRKAALAIYSKTRKADPKALKAILENSIQKITGEK